MCGDFCRQLFSNVTVQFLCPVADVVDLLFTPSHPSLAPENKCLHIVIPHSREDAATCLLLSVITLEKSQISGLRNQFIRKLSDHFSVWIRFVLSCRDAK